MRTVRGLLVLVAVAAVVAACSDGPGSGAATGTGPDDVGLDLTGTWELTAGSGPAGDVEIIPTALVTMEVTAEGGVTGSASCNRYSGTVVVEGDSVGFGPIATTRMACAPRPGAAEAAYLAALEDVATGARAGDELMLTGPETELVYALRG